MESHTSQKRKFDEMENSPCVFCQDEYDRNSLQMATGSGRQKVKDCMERRKALGDVKNKGVIERLKREIIKDSELRWHRKCYSDFTHKEKIGRLETPASQITDTPGPSHLHEKVHSLRGQSTPFNEKRCIYCQQSQEINSKNKLIYVTTFKKSNEIFRCK